MSNSITAKQLPGIFRHVPIERVKPNIHNLSIQTRRLSVPLCLKLLHTMKRFVTAVFVEINLLFLQTVLRKKETVILFNIPSYFQFLQTNVGMSKLTSGNDSSDQLSLVVMSL